MDFFLLAQVDTDKVAVSKNRCNLFSLLSSESCWRADGLPFSIANDEEIESTHFGFEITLQPTDTLGAYVVTLYHTPKLRLYNKFLCVFPTGFPGMRRIEGGSPTIGSYFLVSLGRHSLRVVGSQFYGIHFVLVEGFFRRV